MYIHNTKKMRKPNYDKFPSTKLEGFIVSGWDSIRKTFSETAVLAADLYTGTYEEEVLSELSKNFKTVINTSEFMKSEAEIRSMTQPFMTDDVLYGYLTSLRINDFFDAEKLAGVRSRISAAEGPVLIFGTGAALGKNFFKIQETVMSDLGLTYEPAATQVVGRDRYTELVCLLANIATSLERYGTEVRNLQRSEISEAAEPFDRKKQVGSSTMAQKRNPMMSENVCGLARIVRSMVTPMFESQVLWHERDLSNSSAERFILPHTFTLLDEMFKKMEIVFGGLEVHRDRMVQNIESSHGLIMAESLMMKMTEKGVGRQDAHEIVRSSSMIAEDEGRQLRDVLLEREDLKTMMSEEDIRSAMDPNNYTGGAKEIVDKMVAEVEEKLKVRI